ncbi:VOC family protein [Nocardia wallacei]|uniref:VOC family protein n=1 Tax=Nocardia wallacei TaxID=480035 RepID=UPI00245899F1|nr:VOC family protein [Nocardia wallacei]
MKNQSILISGAGIAGPALAYWLHEYGFRPTVVERAPGPRSGGHAVDIRGTAREVAARMDIVARVRAAGTGARGMAFVDSAGKRVATMGTDVFGHSGGPVAELSIRRTDLARILYDTTSDTVEYVFGDAITAVEQDGDGVRVRFEQGASREFDLLVGADGVRSTVRQLIFGPEERYLRDLGSYMSLFTAPTEMEYDGWRLMYTVPAGDGRPGRTAACYPQLEPGTALTGFFLRSAPLPDVRSDTDAQRRIVIDAFEDDGWLVPEMLAAIWDAPDFYFDRTVQVDMDVWSRDRTVLLGDAGYCASPMSGIGTSLALVGAYILAGELATAGGDHTRAYPAYEQKMRLFVHRAQEFARRAGDGGLMPESHRQLRLRNQAIRMLRFLPKRLVRRGMEKVADTVQLDEYHRGKTMRASTFLWFDGHAEEAADHYTGLFADSAILDRQRDADGRVTTVVFELAGQRYIAYNGGPQFAFSGAISLYLECDTQEEVDTAWAALTEGGQEGPGGSLTDRFGVTWQVVPNILGELLAEAEPEAAQRILTAVHAMTRIDIRALVDARDNRQPESPSHA